MTDSTLVEASPRPEIAELDRTDLHYALMMGWKDFRKAPGFGLVFSAVYVLGGMFLMFISHGFVTQTMILALGFPLIAPFAAVGLYETSRRIEENRPLDLYQIFGVIWKEKDRQIPWVGAIIVIYFMFYSFLAHMIFALFMGLSVMTNVSSSYDVFLTANGLTMVGVEMVVGAGLGFILYGLTVFSLPLLVDKEIDFMTAMLLSFEAVRENIIVMLVWATVIAVLIVLAMIPFFLGLFIVLPVLGHATWHLYRRALIHPE